MKFSNWFKIVWWALLVGILTRFLYFRYPDLIAGHAATADIVAFLIWVALLLAPLFDEVSLLGITLKQEIRDLKESVATQVTQLRSEVRNAVDVRTTINPEIHFHPPPTDAQLPELRKLVEAVTSQSLANQRLTKAKTDTPPVTPKNATLLFAIRYNIELELRRIAARSSFVFGNISLSKQAGTLPIHILLQTLQRIEIITNVLEDVTRQVYSICSVAVHGGTLTQAQIDFAVKAGPDLIQTLRNIDGEPLPANNS